MFRNNKKKYIVYIIITMNYDQLLKLQVDIDRAKLNSMNMHPLMREEMNKCLESIRQHEIEESSRKHDEPKQKRKYTKKKS
jgi:hypothetical protein